MERGREEPEDQKPVAHQPPDSVDLRRHPPRDAVCAHVRGLLRDYADGDLEDAFRQAVDLHVHRCRECGLALARAEHEVFRLRRASGPAVRTPEGFSGRTVQRLLVELSGAPAEEPVRQLATAERGARFAGHRYLVGSMLLAAAILVAATVLFSAYSDVEARSGALMAKAIGVSWEAGGRIGTLGPGESVPEGATIVVAENGMAELLWRVQAGKRQPGAALLLHGGSKLEVHGDEPRLLRGTADVDVNRPLALEVGEAARLDLAVGVYHLDAAEFRSFDDALDGRGSSLRVRLETLQGEGATITRGSQAAVAVGQGQVAVWQGVTPIAVDSVPSETAVVMGLGGASRATPRRIEPPGLVGYVVERPAARPTPDAPVILLYGRGGIASSWIGTTDEHGMFQLPSGLQVDTNFVVAQVMPPAGRSDLGVCSSEIVPLVRNNAGVLLSEPLALDPSPAIGGTVHDENQRPVVGARVVPCVIDELFGSMLPWVEGGVSTDAHGWFTLHMLPSRLVPYTRLGLILLHPDVASCCVPVPAPGTLAATQFQYQFTLDLLTPVTVQHLPPGQPVEFLEELPGTPAGSAVRVHQVNADLQGSAQLRIGAGQVWLKAGQPARQLLRHLVPVDPSPANPPPGNPQTGRTLVPEEPVDAGSVLRTLSGVPGSSCSSFMVARSFRGERFAATAPGAARVEPGMTALSLGAIGELSGQAVPRAELYAVARASDRTRPVARLLGLEDGTGGQPVVLYGTEQTVLAMADDGSLGVTDVDQQRMRVMLSDPGAALLGETARPRPEAPRQVVALRFTPRQGLGLLPRIGAEFVRFACAAEGWQVNGVPPGDYEVAVVAPSGRSWIVTVLSGQIVPLH